MLGGGGGGAAFFKILHIPTRVNYFRGESWREIAWRGGGGGLWGAVAQWTEHLQLKQESLGLAFWQQPWFVFFLLLKPHPY